MSTFHKDAAPLMDYYAIVSFDVADSAELRATTVEEHRQRIAELDTAGRVLTAGPLPRTDTYGQQVDGAQGSIVIAAFDSLEEARQWAGSDPYQASGVYYESTVYPYKPVFG